MKSESIDRMRALYARRSRDVGDRLFFSCLGLARVIADIIGYIFSATVHTIAPAIFFTWLILKITPIPGGVKVFLVVLLTLGSCLLLASLFDPFFRRMRTRSERFSRAIDDWIEAERGRDPEELTAPTLSSDRQNNTENRRSG
jgi:hypothetical protein